MYLLDTNVIIELLHGNQKVIEHIYSVGINKCAICEMTIAELFYGAVKGKNEKNFNDIDTIRFLFKENSVNSCFREYADIRDSLRQQGLTIDLMDVFIASVALHNNLILVTHNTKHFNRIQNIQIEDWQ